MIKESKYITKLVGGNIPNSDSSDEEIDEVREKINAQSARADKLNDALEELEISFEENKRKTEEKLANYKKELQEIKDYLGLEDWDTINTEHLTEIERMCIMDKEKRKENLSTTNFRATIIWENFEDWSSTSKTGKVISSGELKKLLSAKCDKELQYAQVYRAMESFDELTPNQYSYIKKDGKKLVYSYDF